MFTSPFDLEKPSQAPGSRVKKVPITVWSRHLDKTLTLGESGSRYARMRGVPPVDVLGDRFAVEGSPGWTTNHAGSAQDDR